MRPISSLQTLPRLLTTSIPRLRPRPASVPTLCLVRYASSGSRWKARQGKDVYARDAKVQGLKSRAAFKLLEMDAKFRLFKGGQTVVDLGYAPGSWSQVALERTRPQGRIVGIDLIPAQPPRGVATFQGDFLSPKIQALVKTFIATAMPKPKPKPQVLLKSQPPKEEASENEESSEDESFKGGVEEAEVEEVEAEVEVEVEPLTEEKSYFDKERRGTEGVEGDSKGLVDVVLSDMSAPWDQTSGFGSNSLSNPYRRLMNTSGNAFRDHAGSMDLCAAALQFASDTLRPGGHFVCKFYQGSEDKAFEMKLKKMFGKVHREKPESSRSESKEAYFVALRRKAGVVVQATPGQGKSG